MIGYLQQEETILRELYAEDRQLSRADDLAACLEKLGSTYFSSGNRKDLSEALRWHHAATKLRETVYTALPTPANRRKLTSARLYRARVLYHTGTEQNIQKAFHELTQIRKDMEASGADINDRSLQICLFCLDAAANKLGIQPADKQMDVTALPFHLQSYAYSELLEILDYMDEAYVNMIPVHMMALFREYALPGYQRHLNPHIPLEDQQTHKKTSAVLAMLVVSVWSTTQEERDEMCALLEENERKHRQAQGSQA